MAPIFFVKRANETYRVNGTPMQVLIRRWGAASPSTARTWRTVIVSCGGAGVPTLPPRHSSDPIWGKPQQVTGPKGVPTLGDFAAARNPAPTVQR